MANFLIDALSGEQIVESNSLATITESCVLIRGFTGRTQTLLSLSRLSDARVVKVTHPGLLVSSSALGLVSAAAFCSKQGDGAGPPLALVAAVFLIAYFVTRKAFVAFTLGREETYSKLGSISEAVALVEALRNLRRADDERSSVVLTAQ